MFCKQTQNTIDALLRLKQKDEICANVISKLMDQGINKIASVQSTKGELAEFQALLHANLQKFSPQEL
jgi:hypothetical protein